MTMTTPIFLVVLSLICLIFLPDYSIAFMLQSTGNGGLATGLAYDSFSKNYLIAGTLFGNNFWDITNFEDDATHCFVIESEHDLVTNNANVLKRISTTLQRPQVCVGGAILVDHGNTGFGAVMGTSLAGSASVQLLTKAPDTTDESAAAGAAGGLAIFPSTALALPAQTIPVASTAHLDQYIFVAVHGTKGLEFPKQDTLANNLRGLVYNYWDLLTQPPVDNTILNILKFDTVTLEEEFIEIMELSEGSAVYGAIQSTQHTLLVAGSTNGSGDAFGNKALLESGMDVVVWDGFLAWLDTNTGELQHTVRLDPNPGEHNFVHDICIAGDIVYIVGATRDAGPGTDSVDRGFVIKLDYTTRDTLWTKHEQGEAVKCVADDDAVYVGRYVSRTYVPPGHSPMKSQDIMISKYGSEQHEELWSKEIDTTVAVDSIRQDYLVDLVLGHSDNLVALMNSIDFEMGYNDVRLLEFLKDTGRNDFTDGPPDDKKDPVPDDEKLPDDIDLGNNNNAPPTSPPVATPPAVPTAVSPSKEENDQGQKTIIYVAIFVPVLLALWVVAYHFTCGTSSQKEATAPSTDVNDLSLQQEEGEREVV